jgi:uncharacterized membrane protein YphA (DoxX/SURF4 family)
MPVVRKIARPLLASAFIVGGVETLRHPDRRVAAAEAVVPKITERVSFLPADTRQVVMLDAAAKVLGGTMLATGRWPRLAALGLAGSLVPTTLAGHRFWEEPDPAARAAHRAHFLKNLGLLGGLAYAALDTEGRPSLGWRARRLPGSARHVGGHARQAARHAAREARREARDALREARDAVRTQVDAVRERLPG